MILRVKREDARWNELPYAFEAGTPITTRWSGWTRRSIFSPEIGMSAIHAHEQAIIAYAMPRAPGDSRAPGDRAWADRAWRSALLLMEALTPIGVAPHDEDGICVRAGHRRAATPRSLLHPGSADMSFYIYNDEADVDALVAALHRVVRLLGRPLRRL